MASGFAVKKSSKFAASNLTRWVYLSPHFDDVALSCGGSVWEQAQAGAQVSIWTVCGGEIPPGPLSPFAGELHARWKTGREAVGQRRAEDVASCQALHTAYRHLPLPDCIYRRAGESYWQPGGEAGGEHLYASEAAIFGEIDPAEEPLVTQLSARLEKALPIDAELVCPLGLGGHVDHRLTRAAAEKLGRRLWYYADYPYVLFEFDYPERLQTEGWRRLIQPVSPGGLKAWQQSIAAHASQISSFWPDVAAMEQAVMWYEGEVGGGVLWERGQ